MQCRGQRRDPRFPSLEVNVFGARAESVQAPYRQRRDRGESRKRESRPHSTQGSLQSKVWVGGQGRK